jgi:guanylate kinase
VSEGQKQRQKGRKRGTPVVLVLHGPSGVGKESVIAGLQRAIPIHRATSTTDRAPRPGERDGVDYHFVTTEEFERRIREGAFAEHARVYGDWKGLERREIEGPIQVGRDVIIRTDVQGARTWRERLEGAVSVVIVAVAHDLDAEQHRSVTRERIIGRDGKLPPEVLSTRLNEVDEEIADLPNNDYVVVNGEDGLEDAVAEILEIIERERMNPSRPRPRFVEASRT